MADSDHPIAARIPPITRLDAWIVACMVAGVVTFCLPWVKIDMHKPIYTQATYGRTKTPTASKPAEGLFGRKMNTALSSFGKGTKQAMHDVNLEMPDHLSGRQIPRMANHEGAKTILLLVERFTKKQEHIGLKSYAVYLLPGLALLFGIALLMWGRVPLVGALIGVLCVAVAGGVARQLATVDLKMPVMHVSLLPGLWLSLTPYVGLAGAAACRVWESMRSRRLAAASASSASPSA